MLKSSKRIARGAAVFRVRAKWEKEETGRGGYQIVVTEIPYQVQKAKLVEKIADLMVEKKLPLLGDIRDESAEEVRLVLEPKSRTIDPLLLMESLFRVTELEIRFGLNMNVLSAGQIPNVLGLKDVLKQWLEHRVEVLVRRSEYRLKKIEHRLEVLDGYLIAYLNIDEVIRIVRFEDEPKQKLIQRFKLSDVQAEAILNLRLKSLSKLEEVEIKAEHDKLSKEKRQLQQLLKSDDLQWERISEEVKSTRERYSKKTELGRRRSSFGGCAGDRGGSGGGAHREGADHRHPVRKGLDSRDEGASRRSVEARLQAGRRFETGRPRDDHRQTHPVCDQRPVFHIGCGPIAGWARSRRAGPAHGRSGGKPRLRGTLRTRCDAQADRGVKRRVRVPGAEEEVVASTRKGKQILNVADDEEAAVVVPADGDMVATIGENRKLLVFKLEDVNEMTRGKGTILQRFKDGGLSDIRVFNKKDGLTWLDSAGRTFTLPWSELKEWVGERAQAGHVAPKGFPRSNKFGPSF